MPGAAGGAADFLEPSLGGAVIDDDISPSPIEKKGDIFVSIYSPRSTVYTDQTGRFPQQSSRGNNYQMVLFDVDSSSTWVEPMKNRTEGELILARRQGLARM